MFGMRMVFVVMHHYKWTFQHSSFNSGFGIYGLPVCHSYLTYLSLLFIVTIQVNRFGKWETNNKNNNNQRNNSYNIQICSILSAKNVSFHANRDLKNNKQFMHIKFMHIRIIYAKYWNKEWGMYFKLNLHTVDRRLCVLILSES